LRYEPAAERLAVIDLGALSPFLLSAGTPRAT
jgi:hypothetical protein